MSEQQRLWNRHQTAAWLGIGLRTLDEQVRSRTIPSIRIGRRRMFDVQELERWLRENREGGMDNGQHFS